MSKAFRIICVQRVSSRLLHIFEKNSMYTHILNLYTFSRAIDLPIEVLK